MEGWWFGMVLLSIFSVASVARNKSIPSTNQQRRPLPSLLYLSVWYGQDTLLYILTINSYTVTKVSVLSQLKGLRVFHKMLAVKEMVSAYASEQFMY